MLADLTIDGTAAQGRDAGAEERLLLRARSRQRPADLRAAVPADVADEEHTAWCTVTWAYAVDPRPAGRSRTRRRDTWRRGARPARARSARTTGTRCRSARRPGSSTSRRRTWHFPYAHDASPVTREGFNNLGVLFDPLPDDNAVRRGHQERIERHAPRVGSGGAARGLAFGQTRSVERRDAGDRRRARVPGHGRRPVSRAGCPDREDAVVHGQSGRDACRSDQLRDRRRAVHRRARLDMAVRSFSSRAS